MLGEDCFQEESITATFDINGFTIVLLVRATAEELRRNIEGNIDHNTIVRLQDKSGGDLPFQLN